MADGTAPPIPDDFPPPLPVGQMIPAAPLGDAAPAARSAEPAQQEPEVQGSHDHESIGGEAHLTLVDPRMRESIQWALELEDFDDDAPAAPGWNGGDDDGSI
jgi:hypothetical protein